MSDNPYRDLGVTPELAKLLRADDLEQLVISLYRILAKATHPDRRGDKAVKRFQKIQTAYDRLSGSDPALKAVWLKQLRQPRSGYQKQIENLREQLSKQAAEREKLAERLLDFWTGLAGGETVLQRSNRQVEAISIFPQAPVSLLILDQTADSLISQRYQFGSLYNHLLHQKAFQEKSFELVIAGGKVSKQSLAPMTLARGADPPANTPSNWVHLRQGSNKSFYWRRVGRVQKTDYRPIGSLEKTPEGPTCRHQEERFLDLLVPDQPKPEDLKRLREAGFPRETFRDCAAWIIPAIKRGHLLLAVTQRPAGEVAFHILGKVLTINILS